MYKQKQKQDDKDHQVEIIACNNKKRMSICSTGRCNKCVLQQFKIWLVPKAVIFD